MLMHVWLRYSSLACIGFPEVAVRLKFIFARIYAINVVYFYLCQILASGRGSLQAEAAPQGDCGGHRQDQFSDPCKNKGSIFSGVRVDVLKSRQGAKEESVSPLAHLLYNATTRG